MSGQLQLPVAAELESTWNSAQQSNDTTALVIGIESEQLVLKNSQNTTNPTELLDALREGIADERAACYFVIRLDGDRGWVQVSYIPDKAPPRSRMLYASTAEALKTRLGTAVKVHVRCAEKAEVAWGNIDDAVNDKLGDNSATREQLMTDKERERADERLHAMDGASNRTSYVHGVHADLEEAAQAALKELQEGKIEAVVLKLDGGKLAIHAKQTEAVDESTLKTILPPDAPRFIIFRWRAKNDKVGVFFLYSCPDNCAVRERFEYSSTKAAVISHASSAGIELARKSECAGPSEISGSDFDATLGDAEGATGEGGDTEGESSSPTAAKKFARPSRPGKGGARLV